MPPSWVARVAVLSGPRADDDQVLLLEASVVIAAEVPLVAEAIERLVELSLPPVAARVVARGDRRSVLGLEVLAVVARTFERGDLENGAFERAEVDAVSEELLDVLLPAPQRRRLGTGRRRGRERSHRLEQRPDHAFGRPVQHPDRPARAADPDHL